MKKRIFYEKTFFLEDYSNLTECIGEARIAIAMYTNAGHSLTIRIMSRPNALGRCRCIRVLK